MGLKQKPRLPGKSNRRAVGCGFLTSELQRRGKKSLRLLKRAEQSCGEVKNVVSSLEAKLLRRDGRDITCRIGTGLFFEDEAGDALERLFQASQPSEPFPDRGTTELSALLTFLAIIGEGCVSSLDTLAIGDVVFEILARVIDECRFSESLVGQGERGVFGKDLFAVSTSEANSPGADAANQIAFPNAELSRRDIVPGKVSHFLQPGHVSRWQPKARSITDWL